MLDTDRDWRALAKHDPLWVVASWPGKENAWTPEAFYALGESDAADALARWERYEPKLGGVCVEVGCGAGRITIPLTRRFDHVIGLDVSQDMLNLARNVAPGAELVLVSGTTIPLESNGVDAVFTTHVLQHLEGIENVTAYLGEMFRVLRPGGTLMAHTGIGPAAPPWRAAVTGAKVRLARSRLRRGQNTRYFHSQVYPRALLRERLHRIGFVDVELVEFEMRSNHDPHPFFLCRKPHLPGQPMLPTPDSVV